MKKKADTLIEVKNLTKSFKDKLILDNISFDILENEVLGVIGFSGEGKSTLLNLLCFLDLPQKGEIKFSNELSKKNDKSHPNKSLIGYSSQDHSFYRELSLLDNLNYFGHLYGLNQKDLDSKIKFLLKKFKLEEYNKVISSNLSEGQKKRLDLACSLINDPKILLLDEPTANLDFKLRDEFLCYIKELKKNKISIIFVSHNLEEIEEICDRVLILNQKKIEVVSKVKDVKKHLKSLVKNG